MASVSIYAEGTFEEQVQDLVNYLVRNKPEEERTSGIQPFQESLRAEYKDPAEKKRKVIKQILDKVSGFGEGNDKGPLVSVSIYSQLAFTPLPRNRRLFQFAVCPSLVATWA